MAKFWFGLTVAIFLWAAWVSRYTFFVGNYYGPRMPVIVRVDRWTGWVERCIVSECHYWYRF
jgi:hypothetical protein